MTRQLKRTGFEREIINNQFTEKKTPIGNRCKPIKELTDSQFDDLCSYWERVKKVFPKNGLKNKELFLELCEGYLEIVRLYGYHRDIGQENFVSTKQQIKNLEQVVSSSDSLLKAIGSYKSGTPDSVTIWEVIPPVQFDGDKDVDITDTLLETKEKALQQIEKLEGQNLRVWDRACYHFVSLFTNKFNGFSGLDGVSATQLADLFEILFNKKLSNIRSKDHAFREAGTFADYMNKFKSGKIKNID